jgi:hypothetical protein
MWRASTVAAVAIAAMVPSAGTAAPAVPASAHLVSKSACDHQANLARAHVLVLHPGQEQGSLSTFPGASFLVRVSFGSRTFAVPSVKRISGGPIPFRRVCAARQGSLVETLLTARQSGTSLIQTRTADCGPCAQMGASVRVKIGRAGRV